MIEVTLKNYIENKIKVSVYLEKPANPTLPFIIIEKTGSNLNEHVYSTTFAIQSYGASLYAAATLNESVKACMSEFYKEGSIANCNLNSDYNYTDVQSKEYRYQAVYDITEL